MSDAKVGRVIRYAGEIESLLVSNFGATGAGWQEKVSSVEHLLSPEQIKKMRFIVSVRNKMAHGETYQVDNWDAFFSTCEEVIRFLKKGKFGSGITGDITRNSPSITKNNSAFKIVGKALDTAHTGIIATIAFVLAFPAICLNYVFFFAGIVLLIVSGIWLLNGSKEYLLFITSALILATPFISSARNGGGYAFISQKFRIAFFVLSAILFYVAGHFPDKDHGTHVLAYVFIWYSALEIFLLLITDKGQGGRLQVSTSSENSSEKFLPNVTRQPKYTFKNLVGMSDLKAKLLKAGNEIKTSIAKKPKKGEEYEEPRNGILLFGDPGNGKTFIAECLAGELGLPFVELRAGEITSKWIGQTTEQLLAVVNEAVACAPSVLFIDEVDSLLIKRENVTQAENEATKIVNTMLTKLVGLRSSGVVIIAATNFIDRLDSAAIREGRFDYKIEVPPPDLPARMSVFNAALNKKLGGLPVTIDQAAVQTAVERWDGFSIARIRGIAEELADRIKQDKQTTIGFDDIKAALRRLQGTLGTPIKDSDFSLEQMSFPEQLGKQLNTLAKRMINIVEIEKLDGAVPKGVLFYGPPGTGKTASAKALAKTTGWAFLYTSGQDLLADQKAIDKLLSDAANIRPCIVMIDEADDVLADRNMSPHTKAITNKLLTSMDGGSKRSSDILFIAATNNPQTMDSAALRGGRFTEKLEFALPDLTTIARYVETWEKTSKAKLVASLNAQTVAQEIGEASLANVKEILQQAVNHMIGRGEIAGVELEDIRTARNTVLSEF